MRRVRTPAREIADIEKIIQKIIAVTGASGFIGQHVCSDLFRRGYLVRALTSNPLAIKAGVQAHFAPDLRDVELLRTTFRGVNAVIHLAGRAHVMSDTAGDSTYHAVNVAVTRAVAEAAATEMVSQMIFASSVKAIGEGGEGVLSDASLEKPEDAYGRSKLEAEHVLSQTSKRDGLHVTILRLPLVYGPGVKGNLRRLFDAVWRGFPIPVSEVPNTRSMLGVENALAFIDRLLQEPLVSQRPFLLSDSESVSTEGLVRMIGTGLHRRPRIVKLPLTLLRGAARVGDVIALSGMPAFTTRHFDRLTGSMIVDSSRAWREAGIHPPLSVQTGIARTAAWYVRDGRDQRIN
jgi:nucleoside-diphosphate-sugar epimerase